MPRHSKSAPNPFDSSNTFSFFEKGVQTKSWTNDDPDWNLHTQQGLACILHFSAFKDWLFCTFPHLSSFIPKEAFGDAIIDVGRHPKSVFARQIRNSGLRATEYPLASVAESPLLREIALETQTKALKRRPMSLFARLRRGGEGQARGKGARGHAPCSNNPRAGGQPTGLSVALRKLRAGHTPAPCSFMHALYAAYSQCSENLRNPVGLRDARRVAEIVMVRDSRNRGHFLRERHLRHLVSRFHLQALRTAHPSARPAVAAPAKPPLKCAHGSRLPRPFAYREPEFVVHRPGANVEDAGPTERRQHAPQPTPVG